MYAAPVANAILRKYFARGMSFDPATKTWTFTNGKTLNFNLDGDVTGDEDWETLKVKDWSETPWRIFSTDLEAANLSVPELRNYLRFNSDFTESLLAPYQTYYYYQWAVPASCIVVVRFTSLTVLSSFFSKVSTNRERAVPEAASKARVF